MDLPPIIGRYEVLEPLGQGGMGRVLLARDTVLGRRVAVKILRDDLGLTPEVRAELVSRMQNEARAAASLHHPHIVSLFDMGEDPVVGLFLVFEYVEGPTLRDRIHQGPLDPYEVATLGRQLGEALAEAHRAGVVHRDIKPENILLSRQGAKIADFGIARIPDSTLTQKTTVLGTTAYSAPEALAQGEFSAASDQFSLAATLYEALSSRRAFAGDDVLVVATKVATEDPAPLGSIDLDPRAVIRVDRVLRRALSKDKRARFASATDFGDALAIAVESRAFSDPPPSLSGTLGQSTIFRRQNNRVQNIAAAGALLVIVALVLFGRKTRRDDEDDKDAGPAVPTAITLPVASSAPSSSGSAHHRGRRDAGVAGDAGAVAPGLGLDASAEEAGASADHDRDH